MNDENIDYAVKTIEFKLEEKAISEDGRFSGLAAVYNNVDGGGDRILPGAFAKALQPGSRMPKMLWQHDPSEVIGVWETLKDSEKGLRIDGRLLTQIQRAKDAQVLLRAGAIDSLSIGYRAVDFKYIETAKGMIRELAGLDLYEVSLVTFPMNPKALVTDVKQLQTPREVETILHAAGVPSSFAKLVAKYGFDEAKSRLTQDRREAGEKDEIAQADFSGLLTEIRSLKELINGKG